ncbi:MAG: hypothetical protein NZ750_03445 [Anaerolineae bacterium]|nr:hypothetical protein [Anaerolineae bacterium]MDW8171375.1 hypothetical protein [Anaerolineae bacterium]
MWSDFVERAQALGTHKLLLICPRVLDLPLPIQRFDDPFFPFSKALVSATSDLVDGYLLDFASYLAVGAPGAVALERTIAFIPQERLKVLHGNFGGRSYHVLVDPIAFTVDALTIAHEEDMAHYLSVPPHAALWVVRPGVSHNLAQGGVYDQQSGQADCLVDGQSVYRWRVLGDEVVYAGRGQDFAERAREALLAQDGR